jgi:hypothetical protein
MKIILTAVYGLAAVLVLLCGLFYPAVVRWSYLGAGACGLYGVLSLIVAVRPLADGGRIAAWCWHGLSVLITEGLLLVYVLGDTAGWFLVAVGLAFFSVVATLVFCLVLKPGGGVVGAR